MSGTGSLPDDPGERLEEILADHRDEAEDTPDVAPPPDPLDPFAPLATVPAGDDTGEDGPDEDDAPETPLFALLRTVDATIGVDRIDRIWIFPPRRLQTGETAVVVVAVYPELDQDRRKVWAAHYTAHEDAAAPRLALDEYGTAPSERVGRLVEEVVERIKEGPAAAPTAFGVEGREDRWNAMLHELAEGQLERARRNRRLRP